MARARVVLLWEDIWRAIWPAACVVGLFAAVSLIDLLPRLPGWLHVAVLAGFAAALLWTLVRAVRIVSLPSRASAERRLEAASGLDHRPLQVISDRLAAGARSSASSDLWEIHKQRMAEAAHKLKAGAPSPGVARLDRVALRAAVLVFLLIGVVVGRADPADRFARAVNPNISLLADAARPKLEIWITPPEYTRLAPIFPKAEMRPEGAQLAGTARIDAGDGVAQPNQPDLLAVPEGSKVVARVAGGQGLPTLVLGTEDRIAFETVDAVNSQVEATISRGDRLVIEQDGKALGSWPMTVVSDAPPAIAFARPPFPTKGATLGIAYTAADDYGLEQTRVEIRRTYENGTVVGKEVTELELPLPGVHAKTANETSFNDLAPHAWAGLPVTMRLKAVDVAGQESHSEDVKLVLPEREFRHPVARAIIEQRKRLTTEPERRRSIFVRLGEIAAMTDAYANDTVVFLSLVAARGRLRYERDTTAIDPVRDLLWATALRVEDGQLSIAERELRRLEQELMKALAENAPDKELERLMRELENAMNRYLQALAEQLRKQQQQSQQQMPFDPRMKVIQGQDLQRMMEQIRKLMRAGARDAARQMLAQLRNLMESLRSARMFRGNPQAQQQNGAMRQLQEMIRRQSELMNQTFRQSRNMTGPRDGQSQQGATQQRQLREMLRKFRQMMGQMRQGQQGRQGQRGRQGQQGQQGPGQALREADREMGRAEGALGRNAPGEAVGPMGEALDRLQRAGRGMMRQMMGQFSRDSGMGLRGQFNPLGQRRDPLGRLPPGEEGMDTRDVVIPDEGAVQRAQRILEELRRRAGQHHRPRFELDYIDRLLQRF